MADEMNPALLFGDAPSMSRARKLTARREDTRATEGRARAGRHRHAQQPRVITFPSNEEVRPTR